MNHRHLSLLKKLALLIAFLLMFLFAYASYSLENFDLSRISRSNLAYYFDQQSLLG
jgi:hypothetical protein